MAKFPTRKNDIRALAQLIEAGLVSNPLIFTIPPFNLAALAGRNAADIVNRSARQNLEGQLAAAIETENDGLDLVIESMKQQLAQCEASFPGDESKLALLGWGSAGPPGPPVVISQPVNLQAITQGPGSLFLDWNSPSSGRASLRYYKIERQIANLATNVVTEEWGVWQATATASEIELLDQPRGAQISYRVSAVNSTMTSTPSNSVQVVL